MLLRRAGRSAPSGGVTRIRGDLDEPFFSDRKNRHHRAFVARLDTDLLVPPARRFNISGRQFFFRNSPPPRGDQRRKLRVIIPVTVDNVPCDQLERFINRQEFIRQPDLVIGHAQFHARRIPGRAFPASVPDGSAACIADVAPRSRGRSSVCTPQKGSSFMTESNDARRPACARSVGAGRTASCRDGPRNSLGLPKAFHARHGTGDGSGRSRRPLHARLSPARNLFAAELTRDLARCAALERESNGDHCGTDGASAFPR